MATVLIVSVVAACGVAGSQERGGQDMVEECGAQLRTRVVAWQQGDQTEADVMGAGGCAVARRPSAPFVSAAGGVFPPFSVPPHFLKLLGPHRFLIGAALGFFSGIFLMCAARVLAVRSREAENGRYGHF